MRSLENIERNYVGKFYKAIKAQLGLFTAESISNGTGILQLDMKQFGGPMLQVMQDLYVSAGTMMAGRTLAGLRREVVQKRTLGFSQQWTDDIIRYFRANNLDMVTKIDQTTRTHILRILEQGTIDGLSAEEMATLINDTIYMRHRAIRIVRTESTRAANYGIQIGAGSYQYEVVKEWLAINDNRTRHSHRSVDGQQRETDQPFSNGLQFPGDPEGPAKETVNCRCTQVMEPKRDANGRLIPKSRISVIAPGDFNRTRQTILI